MTDGSTARALVRSRQLVVLDFDGPITRLLPGEEYLRVVAGALELVAAQGLVVDDALAAQTDHVQLLRLVLDRDEEVGRRLERWCTQQETAAAVLARPVPAAAAFAALCAGRGVAVAVVTNNAPGAVASVLAHGGPALTALPVHGRDPLRLDRLKPSPGMLLTAAREAGVAPAAAVMVGDTVGDVRAAAAAGMPCIGLSDDGNRRLELLAAGAVATVAGLAELLPGAPRVAQVAGR